MKVEVELYGGLRARAGRRVCTVEVSQGATVKDVVQAVEESMEFLKSKMGAVAVAVDDEIVGGEFVVSDGAKVAFLPPVSGGADGRR